MFRTLVSISLLTILLIGVVVGQLAANEPDPILDSFERDLNHEPTPAALVRRDAIDNDELYELVNAVHWTRNDRPPNDPENFIQGENDDEEDSNE